MEVLEFEKIMCQNKNSKILKLERTKLKPTPPSQLPNKFKMSKLGPKNLFKKNKKKNHPTLDWKASSHGKATHLLPWKFGLGISRHILSPCYTCFEHVRVLKGYVTCYLTCYETLGTSLLGMLFAPWYL